MVESYYHRMALLEELNVIIKKLGEEFNFDPSNCSIMGGFARRLYMLEHNIEMTEVDEEALTKADIDIFFDIRDFVDVDVLELYNALLNRKGESKVRIHRHEDDCRWFKDRMRKTPIGDINILPLISKLDVEFHEPFSKLVKMLDGVVVGGIVDGDGYLTEKKQTTVPMFSDIVRNYPAPLRNTVRIYEGGVVVNPHYSKSLMLSPSKSKVVIPIGNDIQLIFGLPVEEEIKIFDIEQAKFAMQYPFSSTRVECRGQIDINNFYHIANPKLKEQTPFKFLDRYVKYSEYGFTFDDGIHEQWCEFVDDFIDNHDIKDLPSISSYTY